MYPSSVAESLRRFGSNVRRARILRGWSQEELAVFAGLHRTYIGGVERGERNISLLTILKLANALGVSPTELVGDIDNTSEEDG